MNNKNEFKYQEFYNYIIKMISISKIGMVFSNDLDAKKSFKQIHDVSMETLENFEHLKFTNHDFFRRSAYLTPCVKMCIAIINRKNEILLIKDKLENTYSLPGGYCDLYDSPTETALNKCYEQAGVQIKNIELKGIFNEIPFDDDSIAKETKNTPEYLILVKAQLDSKFVKEDDNDDINFFNLLNLPKLSSKFSNKVWEKLISTLNNDIITID